MTADRVCNSQDKKGPWSDHPSAVCVKLPQRNYDGITGRFALLVKCCFSCFLYCTLPVCLSTETHWKWKSWTVRKSVNRKPQPLRGIAHWLWAIYAVIEVIRIHGDGSSGWRGSLWRHLSSRRRTGTFCRRRYINHKLQAPPVQLPTGELATKPISLLECPVASVTLQTLPWELYSIPDVCQQP